MVKVVTSRMSRRMWISCGVISEGRASLSAITSSGKVIWKPLLMRMELHLDLRTAFRPEYGSDGAP